MLYLNIGTKEITYLIAGEVLIMMPRTCVRARLARTIAKMARDDRQNVPGACRQNVPRATFPRRRFRSQGRLDGHGGP